MLTKNLPSCPASPNCVSSQAKEPEHFIEPFTYTDSGRAAFIRLKETIEKFPGARIVEFGDCHLRAEFRTRWLKFTDDFEAILNEQQQLIHVRSASRIGYWDLGTNRKRVEKIRRSIQNRSNQDPR